ncbi:MAG TPA: DUF5686 family protein [Puia sp.]|nr:DUF5686 family protein [Puia sp.]
MRFVKWQFLFLLGILCCCLTTFGQSRILRGTITDAVGHEPLANASVYNKTGHKGARSDSLGRFTLSVQEGLEGQEGPGLRTTLVFSMVGYVSQTVTGAAVKDSLVISLSPDPQKMQQVVVTNRRAEKYRNKNNPAVELIRKVIANKDNNRPESFDYVSYEEYDKVEISMRDIDSAKFHKRLFRPYRFLFEHPDTVAGDTSRYYPLYLEEKLSDNYFQRKPERRRQVVKAEKKVDFGDLIDTKGLSSYVNTLLADVDIYDNNILLFTNQFLSPMANAAPTYYEFFLGDTVVVNGARLVRLNFQPRNNDDLLFRGMFYITLDGNYAVQRVQLTLSKRVNLNFIKNLHVREEFQRTPSGHYYRVVSDASADFSFSGKKKGIHGRKYVAFAKLQTGKPIADSVFRQATAAEPAPEALSKSDSYWDEHRQEPLSAGEVRVYANIDSLRRLRPFIRAKDVINLVAAGYKSAGPFEIGPVNTFYSFNPIEGFRLAFGGRSTPVLSKRIWLDGYGAYGFGDRRWKYNAGVAYSFNRLSDYGYPQHYLKFGYQHDLKIPGQELQFVQDNSFLASFKRGVNDVYLYNDIFRIDYLRELPNHLSYGFGFKYWAQQPAGAIEYVQPKRDVPDTLTNLVTSQFSAQIRWAPHEKFYQGRVYRIPFPNQYPVFSLQFIAGIKGFAGGNYSYQDVNLNIYKRFYLSTFGYTDVTLSGSYVAGKLPFPLLQILPANQTYIYQPDSYNLMNFLEFVSDHYAGVDVEHHFNGFIFNKIPVLKRLKWREILTAKLLYGGLRAENDPAKNASAMRFPLIDGQASTFALGNQPYLEAGFAIGNIFKLLRVDLIERFSYLDHPNVPRYGVRFQIKFDY